jgi:hypothetical protein
LFTSEWRLVSSRKNWYPASAWLATESLAIISLSASEKSAMNIEQLRAAYKAEPFAPFVLHLADGREIAVPHRDFLYVFPSGRMAIVTQPDESFNIIDMLLVTDLEFKSPSRGNGKGRRKPGAR